MKLSKALKLKNKLAGEVAQAQRLINESNVTQGDNEPQHDVRILLGELVTKQEQLADLKARIAVANGPIYQNIFMMAELKARIAFLRTLPTKDGNFLVEGRYGTDSRERDYHATIKAAEVEEKIKQMSAQIEHLQDEVDEYNSNTSI